MKVKDPEGAAFYCATQDDSHIQKYLLPHKLDSLDLYAVSRIPFCNPEQLAPVFKVRFDSSDPRISGCRYPVNA